MKLGIIDLDPVLDDWENPPSESYVELGIKSANRKKVQLHRYLAREPQPPPRASREPKPLTSREPDSC